MAARFSILCIDDTPDSLHLMQATLLRAGHQVHTALGGIAGIDVLQQLSSLDVILVNDALSDISGLDVLVYLASKPRFATTGVVFTTTHCVLDLPTRHAAWPRVDVCLPRPFQPNELYDAVFEAYTRRRGFLYRLTL